MSEREEQDPPDGGDTTGQEDKPADEWVREVEEDPATAGGEKNPADELRGG